MLGLLGRCRNIIYWILSGICKVFEEHLKKQNPTSPSITYDISELFQFIDPPTRRPNTTGFEYTRAGLFHICVTDPQPQILADKIVANGGQQISPVLTVFPGEIYQAVYCLDPFGNLLEIMATSYERQMSNQDPNVTSHPDNNFITSRSIKSHQLLPINVLVCFFVLTLFILY